MTTIAMAERGTLTVVVGHIGDLPRQDPFDSQPTIPDEEWRN
ncbi:MAG: hypothetical protein NZ959_10925 [Armatimonadetes bacterium]|nr:hypothetical protein [Armatimonadota bacterium]MDW8122834.1 hypothetical protein [Armatimonadota bacterium]